MGYFLQGLAEGAGIAIVAALIVIFVFPSDTKRDEEPPTEGEIEL